MATERTDVEEAPGGRVRRLTGRLAAALWAVSAVLCLVAASYGIERVERTLLEHDAEHAALHHADFITQLVPDLERLFLERELSDEAHVKLIDVHQHGEVFRITLFDRAGRQLLVSDNLGTANPLSGASTGELGSHHGNTHVGDIVLGGGNYIELEDGRRKADRPDWYARTYVPLQGADGVFGVIEAYIDQSERQQDIAAAFRQVAAIVLALLLAGGLGAAWQTWRHLTDRRHGEARIRYLAEHDDLSGALNRGSFGKALDAAVRAARESGARFAVHCIDLDGFKAVNDTLGHAAGDRLLCEVTSRLDALRGPDDVLARLGGDEFAFLQRAADGPRDVEAHGQRIVGALADPMVVEEQRVQCGASVGAACFGIDATDTGELLHKADLAMYRSKGAGGGRFSFYDEVLDRALEERRQLALDLRTALADGALSLHYQPLFDAAGEGGAAPSGFEALMRWHHAERGNVTPAVFIPLAEESGLIESLGSWAIERACHDAAKWVDGARVAVNLSAVQFREGAVDVVGVVAAALERSGLAPGRLELEITESLLIDDPERALGTLEALSALGVRIAMDDFGTGYSSLSYLWRFPFDKVKIDRAFVQGLETENKVSLIIASIVSLAHSLGMRVNAEGVETESQREALRRLGCDELQGFLLGRPAPMSTETPIDRRAA